MSGRLPPEVEAERLRRYHAGENDKTIAAAEGCGRANIAMWRASRGLESVVVREREAARARWAEWARRRRMEELLRPKPPPPPPRVWFDARKLDKAEDQRRRDLHAQGWTDGRIANEVGVDRATIGQWRRKNGLAAKGKRYNGRTFDMEERRRLILMGLSDREVAKKQGCASSSVRTWRIRQNLPRNFANVEERKGQGDGRQYFPSLDAPIRGFEDLNMYGTIADSSWSSWLEEMGATVW